MFTGQAGYFTNIKIEFNVNTYGKQNLFESRLKLIFFIARPTQSVIKLGKL